MTTTFVMAGLVPAIHVFAALQGVDARLRGHDGGEALQCSPG
jgi:hypothetical protein